jgi:proteasome lid subunit RPN8/RPN11
MTTRPDVLDAIRAHGSLAYPEECCGFLLGRRVDGDNHVSDILKLENRQTHQRERRYLVSAGDYIAAERAARSRDLDVVGVYHSHPDHPAIPSTTDLEQATFPGFTYAIVSVLARAAGDLSAWTLAPDRSCFVAEPVLLENMS